MEFVSFLFVFLFGLIVGSFLNVLIWRLNSEDRAVPSFWQGRSVCPRCRKQLLWKDNIPLLSFFLLRGKCRFCRKKIPWQYPIVELLTAVFFALAGFHPVILLIGSVFIVIFFSDWIYGLIPDEMIVVGSIAAAIYNQFSNFNFPFGLAQGGQISNLGQNLLVGILSGLGFLLVVVATRFRGMGLGDVKLVFLIGFLLGWPGALVAFWWAFLLGGLAAVFLLFLKKVRLSDKMAFGPYLVLGALFSALWSKELLRLVGF